MRRKGNPNSQQLARSQTGATLPERTTPTPVGRTGSTLSRGNSSMPGKDLRALFLHQLKDTYFAENAILKALPKMAQAAQSEDLKGAFGVHLEETKGQVERLNQVFKLLDAKPEGVPCKAIEGIIAEGDEIIQ